MNKKEFEIIFGRSPLWEADHELFFRCQKRPTITVRWNSKGIRIKSSSIRLYFNESLDFVKGTLGKSDMKTINILEEALYEMEIKIPDKLLSDYESRFSVDDWVRYYESKESHRDD